MFEASVVIPSYNAERFLSYAIESVLHQTIQCSCIIIVDDASTDATVIIGQRYEREYPGRVRYVCHASNKGPNAARNTGINISTTPFIAFLDADDVWLPDKLEKQIALFRENPSLGMVGCGFYIIDEMGINIGARKAEIFYDRDALVNTLMFRSVVNGSASGVITRRECFKNVGLFDEVLKGAEDRDMWLRIAQEYDVVNVDEFLVKIRFHKSSTHTNVKKMMYNQKCFVRKHFLNEGFWKKQKAISHIYLDAAREYYGHNQKMRTLWCSLIAIFTYPLKTTSDDDKYQLFIKSIIRKHLHTCN